MSPLLPLLIGTDERAEIAALVERAAASPTPYPTMKAMAEAHARGTLPPAATLNASTTIELPVGYCCTLTYEEHKPGVMCRHLSVSVKGARPDHGPTPEAVTLIMAAFGFKNALGHLPAWTEPLRDRTLAINLVEPLDGNVAALAR